MAAECVDLSVDSDQEQKPVSTHRHSRVPDGYRPFPHGAAWSRTAPTVNFKSRFGRSADKPILIDDDIAENRFSSEPTTKASSMLTSHPHKRLRISEKSIQGPSHLLSSVPATKNVFRASRPTSNQTSTSTTNSQSSDPRNNNEESLLETSIRSKSASSMIRKPGKTDNSNKHVLKDERHSNTNATKGVMTSTSPSTPEKSSEVGIGEKLGSRSNRDPTGRFAKPLSKEPVSLIHSSRFADLDEAAVTKSRAGSTVGKRSVSDVEPESPGVSQTIAKRDPSKSHPLNLKYAKSLLRQLEQEVMNADQESLVQARLKQAKKTSAKFRALDIVKLSYDPFEALAGPSAKQKVAEHDKGRSVLHTSVYDDRQAEISREKTSSYTTSYGSESNAPPPEYNQIARLSDSVLAPNRKALKYYSHFVIERPELDPELEESFPGFSKKLKCMPQQRLCQEAMARWSKTIQIFLDHLGVKVEHALYSLLRSEYGERLSDGSSAPLSPFVRKTSCRNCKVVFGGKEWQEVLLALPKPDLQSFNLAGMACQAVEEVCKMTIWHFISNASPVLSLAEKCKPRPNPSTADDLDNTMCLICFLHNCPFHGAFLDQSMDSSTEDESSSTHEDRPAIEGESSRHNRRQLIAVPNSAPDNKIDSIERSSSVETTDGDIQQLFVPCAHPGPCLGNAQCFCDRNKIECEWMCGCDKTCKARNKGCTCHAHSNGVCFQSAKCQCWVGERECDPMVCGSCGVQEVLQSSNVDVADPQPGLCQNANLQLGVPRRTLLNHSEVHGWGLFAGEDIEANAFVGEYTGELVSTEESDRRGVIYHYREIEYLFGLRSTQQLDSMRAGSKLRYINNSGDNRNINLTTRIMRCSGVKRIMYISKRKIKAGEELFFCYGYPESKTKNFREKPIMRSDHNASAEGTESEEMERASPKKNAIFLRNVRPLSTEAAKPSSLKFTQIPDREIAGTDDESDSPEEDANENEDVESSSAEASQGEAEDTESSFEANGRYRMDGAVDLAAVAAGSKLRARQVFPNDKRLGGSAQKKAWATRKKNQTRQG